VRSLQLDRICRSLARQWRVTQCVSALSVHSAGILLGDFALRCNVARARAALALRFPRMDTMTPRAVAKRHQGASANRHGPPPTPATAIGRQNQFLPRRARSTARIASLPLKRTPDRKQWRDILRQSACELFHDAACLRNAVTWLSTTPASPVSACRADEAFPDQLAGREQDAGSIRR
jgi:hypothetical protein